MALYYHLKFIDCEEVHHGLKFIKDVDNKTLKEEQVQVGLTCRARWTPNRAWYTVTVLDISKDPISISEEALMPMLSQELQVAAKVLFFLLAFFFFFSEKTNNKTFQLLSSFFSP